MSRPRLPLALALALPLALALVPAHAHAELADADFTPIHTQQLVGLDDFTFDTDWFPMDQPLQLRLIVHGGNSVAIVMPGDGTYDWDAGTIHFTGDAGAGQFDVDVGFTLDAKVRFDVLGIQWESDIIGPYDYAVISGDSFTPYLLPGNPDRPVVIDDETDPVTLVSVPITPDVIVAAGNLDIDVYVIVEASLAGQSIEASTIEPAPQLVVVTAEGEAVPLASGPGPTPDPLVVGGTLVCALTTAPTVVLKPTLVMEILGQKFEIANIEIPIALPPFDDAIRFDTITMNFPRPPATPDDGEGDGTGDSHGDSSSDSDTPTSGDDTADDSTGDDSSITSITSGGSGNIDTAGTSDDGGCECDLHGPAPAPLLALLLLGLRRRRAHA